MAFCSNCGRELAENAKFCSNCGASVPSTETPKTEVPPAEHEKTAEQGSYSGYTPAGSGGEYRVPEPEAQSNEYRAPEREYNTWQSAAASIEEPVRKSAGAAPIIGIIAGVLIIVAALAWIFMSGKGGNDFAGYWKCGGIDLGDGSINDMIEGVINVEDVFGLMLYEDKTFEMEVLGETELIKGTWKADKSLVTLISDAYGEKMKLVYNSDGMLYYKLQDVVEVNGNGITVYFKRGGDSAPAGFGVFDEENIPGRDEGNSPGNPEAAGTPRPSDSGTGASREFEYFDLEILGGEPAEDDYDKNCFRIYYKFTNTSNTALAPIVEVGAKAFQNGRELETAYLLSDVLEDDYDWCYVMPDTSIICTVIYKLEDESPLEIRFYDSYAGDSYYVSTTLDVTENTGGFRNEFLPISNPQWTKNLDSSRDWADIGCKIIGVEPAEDIFGDELIRVNLEFTNNSDIIAQISELVSIEVYQDGVEMFSGYLDDVDDPGYELAPGETVTIAVAYELRSSSPVVVLVYNWESEEYIGDTFRLDW